MKTLIATLAISFAASTAAFAMDPEDAGIPLSLQQDGYNEYDPNANVSAFRVVDPKPAAEGKPLTTQEDYTPSMFEYQPSEAWNDFYRKLTTPRGAGIPKTVQ